MHPKRLEHYKQLLTSMRRRITGGVEHMIESIQEEANPTGNVSNVPIHLGDLATNALDADVQVLETEQNFLGEVQAALTRIQDGSYGLCESCGSEIAEERLESLPHTPYCIKCAIQNSNGTARS